MKVEMVSAGTRARDVLWGLKLPGLRMASAPNPVSAPETWGQITTHYDYIKVGPDSQRVGDCDMETFLGTIGAYWISKFAGIPAPHMQVERAYFKALQDYHGTQADEGLDLQDGAQFLLDNGILTGSFSTVPMTEADLFAALQTGPVAVGQYAGDWMMPASLSPVLAEEDEAQVQGAGWLLNCEGGHARAIIGADVHNGKNIVVIRGSWGNIGYDKACITTESTWMCLRISMVNPILFEATGLGPNWQEWTMLRG